MHEGADPVKLRRPCDRDAPGANAARDRRAQVAKCLPAVLREQLQLADLHAALAGGDNPWPSGDELDSTTAVALPVGRSLSACTPALTQLRVGTQNRTVHFAHTPRHIRTGGQRAHPCQRDVDQSLIRHSCHCCLWLQPQTRVWVFALHLQRWRQNPSRQLSVESQEAKSNSKTQASQEYATVLAMTRPIPEPGAAAFWSTARIVNNF